MTWRRASRAATIALFATAVGVVPASLHAQDIACDRGDFEVRGLEFRGNRAVSDNDLAVRVTTTPSSWGRRHLNLWFAEKRCLNRDELPRDVLRLKAYYRERGFYNTKVDTLVEQQGPSSVLVIFSIDEGKPLVMQSYTISGLEGIRDSADVVRDLSLRVGRPFDLSLLRADMDSIVQRLRNHGYYHAEVFHSYDTHQDSLVARAALNVVSGRQARFGEPEISVDTIEGRGQQIPTPVVRRVLGISPGDLYSDRAIVEAQRALFQLGTYRHIEVAPLPDSLQTHGDTVVILAVRLSEDYMRQLDSEIGWGTLDCGRLRMQYTDRNLFGSARRLELRGQASKIGYGDPLGTKFTKDLCTFGNTSQLVEDPFSNKFHYFTGATVRQPRLLGTRWVPEVSLYSERRGEFRAYLRTTEIGGDFSATREIGDRMPFRLAYTFEYGKTKADPPALCALFNRCDPVSQDRISQLAPLGVASAALARVRTDNVVSPTRGLAMRGELRSSALRFLGTSDSLFFNKATGDVAWYLPFGWRSVLAFRVRGGAVLGRRLTLKDPLGFIPPQERLYAGGPTSVRGFQQNELGSLVYIARPSDVQLDSATSGGVTTYRMHVSENPDSIPSPDRAVPLGGNSLVVANFEYRVWDPFFLPDLLQYSFFVDGGDVWTRAPDRRASLKWTPGFGLRALTPIGPIQVNVGWNGYQRERGQIYHNPDVTALYCVTPNNRITLVRNPSTNALEQQDKSEPCPSDYNPPPRRRWIQKLTFTFSIGPEF